MLASLMLGLRHFIRSQVHPRSLRLASHQTITASPTIRHVRFRRPWLRTFISKTLLCGAAFYLWSSVVLIPFDDDTHDPSLEPGSNLRESGFLAEHGEEGRSPIFLPLTWSRLQEGELYAASDPEWQEFVQISKDQKRLQKLKEELAAFVLESISGQLSYALGSPLSLIGFWLVPQFPHRAPPSYLRSGIEITDDGVSWVDKPLDPEIGDRLQTFMKPVHVVLAMKDVYIMLLQRQVDRVRGQSMFSVDLSSERHLPSSQVHMNPLDIQNQPKLQPPLSDEPSESLMVNSEPRLSSSFLLSSFQRLPLPDLGPGSDLHLASVAFRLRLNEYRARSPRTPLRGSFFFSGPVGIKGPRGVCRVEVRGEYDPAKRAWRTIDMKLRDFAFRKQRPLEGR